MPMTSSKKFLKGELCHLQEKEKREKKKSKARKRKRLGLENQKLRAARTSYDQEKVSRKLFQRYKPFEAVEISQECMTTFYRRTEKMYEMGEYSKAQESYSFLASLDPSNLRPWIGLGHSQYCLGNMQEALRAYLCGYKNDPYNPWLLIYQVRCLKK